MCLGSRGVREVKSNSQERWVSLADLKKPGRASLGWWSTVVFTDLLNLRPMFDRQVDIEIWSSLGLEKYIDGIEVHPAG